MTDVATARDAAGSAPPRPASSVAGPTAAPLGRHRAALDAATLREWLGQEDGPRLLDVRTPGEYAAAHIPGSYSVPLDLLREHRDELRHHLDSDVVLVCRSGARASQAETLLARTGLNNLHVLTGGVSAWEAAGGDLTRGQETWDLERQVRLVAGSLVLAGVAASTVLPRAKWVSAAVGGGLTLAALTDSCLMGQLLPRLPYNRRQAPTLEAVVRALRA